MRYSIILKLNGALADAAAVEWTEAPDPTASGAGWEPCLRLADGTWRIFSYGATDGRDLHWRDPGVVENIGLRYRLTPAGPWSAASADRKEIVIVALEPVGLVAEDWVVLPPAEAGHASTVLVRGAGAGAVAVEWARQGGESDWQPAEPLGNGQWRLVGTSPDLAGIEVVLRYRTEAGGPWSPVSRDAKIVVPEEGGGPVAPVLPFVLAAPALSGAGIVGDPLTLATGLWGGFPAPDLAVQWYRDGVAIDAATDLTYVPGADDDEAEVSGGVTASNPAGEVRVAAAGITVTYAPPVSGGALFEEIFDEGTGWQEVETAWDFTGQNLTFSVEGAGAEIDARSGVVRIPTDAPVAGAEVKVTARNSGGSAASGFVVTVEAAEVVEDRPRPAGAEDWDLHAVSLSAGTHTGVFTLNPDLGAVEVQWLGLDVEQYNGEDELAPHYNPTILQENGSWRHASAAGASHHLRRDGTIQRHIRLRYRTAADGPWSLHSENRRWLDATLIRQDPGMPDPGHPDGEAWHTMSFRTAEEVAKGLRGGCQEQFWHGSARSKSNPNLIIAGQDTGGFWYSDDDGVNWYHAEDSGLVTFGMQGVGIDPVNPDVWFGVGGEIYYTDLKRYAGIYKSTNRGKNWVRKLTIDTGIHHQRVPHNMCHDPTTESLPIGQRVWYAPVHYWDSNPGKIFRSTDGGETWAERASIPVSGTGAAVSGRLSTIWHHPSISGTLFLCTQAGLFKSTDGAARWTRMNGVGGLPLGEVVTLEINPRDGNEIYAVINQKGAAPGSLWRTTNGGTSWSQVTIPANFPASKVHVGMSNGAWQPLASRTLYLVGRGVTNPDGRLRVSHNGGASWFVAQINGRPGMTSAWQNNMSDSLGSSSRPELCTRILPHPNDPNKAVGHGMAHNFRTEDRGVTWTYSGEGFTGLIWGNFPSGVAFSDDPNRFAFGCTDTGMVITKDGGQTFWQTQAGKAPDPAGGSLKDSMHVVAIHPTDPNLIVGTVGFMSNSENTYIFRTSVPNPRTFAHGDWVRVTDTHGPYTFLHWHRTAPSVIYSGDRRSTNAGLSFSGYPSGIGRVVDCLRADNDVIYGISGSGADTELRWSQDRGNTASLFVRVGWNVTAGDVRRFIVTAHPTNRNVIFTRSANGDLARYDRASNSWRTNYGLIAQTRAANPGMPSNFPASVASIAIDPQDPECVYVAMLSPGYQTLWRTQNGQSASPTWENITYNMFRVSRGILAVHPHTGDVFFGTNGIGAARLIPPPKPRSHPSLYTRFDV